jgi:uncharacterized protein YjiK
MIQKYYWVLVVVIATAILYPLQKMIDNKWGVQKNEFKSEMTKSLIPYRVNVPDTTFLLPTVLNEISGLTMCPDPTYLGAVQDERGEMYLINKKNGKIAGSWDFGKGSDYEGLEIIDSTVYIVNSKGNITYGKLGDDEANSKVFKTFLNSDDDVEGLAVTRDKQFLLLACKSSRTKKNKNRKLYQFNIKTKSLDSIPFLELDNVQISKALGREKKTPYFSPSALAIHPQTGELFIISSPAHALIVLDEKGQFKSATNIDPSIHRQPEGITFDDKGTLFIANEAKSGAAKIQVFFPVGVNH